MSKTIIKIEKIEEPTDLWICELCLTNTANYEVIVPTSKNVLYVCSSHSEEEILEHLRLIDFVVRNSKELTIIYDIYDNFND
jgi:hypothetical protein